MADSYDRETGEVVEMAQQHLPATPEAPRREMNLIFASSPCEQIFGALAEAQGKIKNPTKDKTAAVKGRTRTGQEYEYKYKYADLSGVVDAIREPLSSSALVHRQFLAMRDGQWVMRTIIAHSSGQWYGADYPIYFDESKGAQGFASGVTYARRYGLMLALGIVGEDDDDANVADGRPARTEARQTQGTPAPPSTSGNGAYAPPAAPEKPLDAYEQAKANNTAAQRADAQKRHNEIVRLIEQETTNAGLDQILAMPAWANCEAAIRAAEDEGRAAELIEALHQRAVLRRDHIARLQETA